MRVFDAYSERVAAERGLLLREMESGDKNYFDYYYPDADKCDVASLTRNEDGKVQVREANLLQV